MKILVVRFRQMGDAILATPLLSTLRANYPDAQIDFVLNERIAPLFEDHPAISRIITFTDDERHAPLTYIRKVWRTVHETHYDAIIDMRSTLNTMLFALCSLRSRWRIGISKPYTWAVFNRRYPGCDDDESMISHNLRLAEPLLEEREERGEGKEERGKRKVERGERKVERNLSLSISDAEKQRFRSYMQQQGIDFSRPVLLVGVTAKLESKTWPEDRMTAILRRFIEAFPQWQLIFNYAPGREADNARRIRDSLSTLAATSSQPPSQPPSQPLPVFLSIEAKSPRELAAMAANCTAYFGNEGGARHIVHAMGRPSLVVCSPSASKATWLPHDTDITAIGLSASDIRPDAATLTPREQYDLITVDRLWPLLRSFCEGLQETPKL